jgi:hypothetical protein
MIHSVDNVSEQHTKFSVGVCLGSTDLNYMYIVMTYNITTAVIKERTVTKNNK